MDIGGDIFSDFNEDLETGQVLEDERYYHYGRFYSFQVGVGVTTFDGNRGSAYQDEHPTFAMALTYFLDFKVAYGVGVEFSKHFFTLDGPTEGFRVDQGVGTIQVNMFRSFLYYRYYIDTFDLGTAITYSNPYFVLRLEFWNQTNKFIDQDSLPNDSNSALGFAGGFGLEFPVEWRKSYINLEFLLHSVGFRDTFSDLYKPIDDETNGYENLTGNGISVIGSYVLGW